MANKVLIFENDPLSMKLLTDLLHMQGYETVQVSDGLLAEDLVRQHSPDLVLSDFGLKGRTGLDITRALKSDPETRNIPVILTTVFPHSGFRTKAMESGCNAFLVKPYTFPHLFKTVQEFLPKPEQILSA